MLRTIRRYLNFVTAIALIASPVNAAEFGMTLFGHAVSISPSDDQYKLEIDGREVLKNYYLDLDEIYLVGNTPTVVGTSSGGGNACEGSLLWCRFQPMEHLVSMDRLTRVMA